MTSSGIFNDHRHARAPAILRYRGMEAEALMATRLINIETLIASVQLVLDDAQSTPGEWLDFPGITIEGALRRFVQQADGHDPDDFAFGRLKLVESVLETALSHVRKGAETARERLRERVWENGGRDGSNDESSPSDQHGKPWAGNGVRGRNCCADHFEVR